MVRIYFDKQVFSHLFKQEKSEYINLLRKIKEHKTSLFCYSHAHLLDLKSDKTNIKYRELEFMESIVEDNYLSYHALEKTTSCYLARPLEAFTDVEEDNDHIDFSTIFDFDTESLDPEEKEKIEKAKSLFYDTKLDFGFPELKSLPEEITGSLEKVLPFGFQSMTLMQWTEHFMGIYKNMKEDKTVYKGVRNMTDKHFNNGKYTVNYDEIDFNEDGSSLV